MEMLKSIIELEVSGEKEKALDIALYAPFESWELYEEYLEWWFFVQVTLEPLNVYSL